MLEQQLTALHIFKTNLNTFLLNREEIMEGYDAVKSFREGNTLPGCGSCHSEGLLLFTQWEKRKSQVQKQKRCWVTVWWLCTRDHPPLRACEMIQPGELQK